MAFFEAPSLGISAYEWLSSCMFYLHYVFVNSILQNNTEPVALRRVNEKIYFAYCYLYTLFLYMAYIF